MNLTDDLRGVMLAQLHRYAVSKRIFCSCGTVLDVRRSVMLTTDTGGTDAICVPCWQRVASDALEQLAGAGVRGLLVVSADGVWDLSEEQGTMISEDQGVLW